ncbi:MAG: amidohydrolase family protein [Acidobacteria bacterium]|nr:amidohydrolase family protein [Acidobacteriota bacterium]
MRATMLLLLLAAATLPSAAQNLAIDAEVIHTMAGKTIRNGVILIKDGKIIRVGPESETPAPAGTPRLTAKVVTPGLIDAHSVVGLAGYLNQPHDQDQLEKSAAIQPELRAIDSYNAREFLVGWLRGFGVTTIHTGHGPGALVSGQTMIAKTSGDTIDESVVVPSAMIAANLGEDAFAENGKSPGTRAKELALLRQALLDAQEYRTKISSAAADKKPSRDLRKEAFVTVLERATPLMITVNRAQDIVSALRLANEFDIRVVLDGCADAHLVVDEIAAARVPVIVHPTMARPFGEDENLTLENAAILERAGIPTALQSGYEGYVPKTRVVLLEAAMAAANGLSFDEALGMITVDAAKILGVSDRVGSIEPGKDADLALFDGDPFEYTTHITGVVINGKVVSEEVR